MKYEILNKIYDLTPEEIEVLEGNCWLSFRVRGKSEVCREFSRGEKFDREEYARGLISLLIQSDNYSADNENEMIPIAKAKMEKLCDEYIEELSQKYSTLKSSISNYDWSEVIKYYNPRTAKDEISNERLYEDPIKIVICCETKTLYSISEDLKKEHILTSYNVAEMTRDQFYRYMKIQVRKTYSSISSDSYLENEKFILEYNDLISEKILQTLIEHEITLPVKILIPQLP